MKHQLDIQALSAARVFARTLPQESRQTLRDCLRRLNLLKRNGYRNCRLLLVGSWPDHSFAWAFQDPQGRTRFNGGLLLHGFEPTLAVTLETGDHPRWSIHT
jgi:hypothetical protein